MAARVPALEQLPVLGSFRELPSVSHPPRLGWINYLSIKTAVLLGFPDDIKDREWLERSSRTENGAWIVAITEESLDPEREDHVETLVRAYQRFDKIGAKRS